MLIPVKDRNLLQAHGIHFAVGTLRRWHSQGINAQLFVKIGGRLFINLAEWEKFIKEKSQEEKERAERIKALKA